MLTIPEIDKLIDQTAREGSTLKESMESAANNNNGSYRNVKKVFTKVNKRLLYYRMVRSYLQTNPKKEFIQNEYDRVTNRMSMIGLNFSHDLLSQNADVIKKKRAEYEKEQGVPKLREQQKCLKFILSK